MNTENKYLSTFQWFIYLLANSIALPIVIGNVYHLSEQDISSLMQRTFFIVGLSSFLQAKFGHRYPVADGPAGSWVSIFVIYASVAVGKETPMLDTLQILEAGIIIAGLTLFLLGITKWVRHLLILFSPIVTGTFLFILAIQLGGVFFKGMASSNGTGQLDIAGFILALLVFFLILFLNIKGKGRIKSYAILIGILLGWLAFALLGKGQNTMVISSEIIRFPEIFAWGLPKFNSGIIVTALLFTFLLISNTFAAISAAEEVIPHHKGKSKEERLNTGAWTGGISHLLSAVFSAIPAVPLPATAGFIKLTKQFRILPFLSACGILIVISLFPGIVSALASLPMPVASAALLAALLEMLGIAIRSLTKQSLNERNITIIGVALLMGMGIMFLPAGTFAGLPNVFQHIFTNGLLVGTFLAMILDRLWKEQKNPTPSDK